MSEQATYPVDVEHQPGVIVAHLPERAAAYVNPETGESGLTFEELRAQLPHLYPNP